MYAKKRINTYKVNSPVYTWYKYKESMDTAMYTKKRINTYKVNSPVYTWYKYKESMDTTTWCKKEKPGKVGMVEMTAASVNPWAMVVHLHHTSVTERRAQIFFPCPENILDLDLLASSETNLSDSDCFEMVTIYTVNKKFTSSTNIWASTSFDTHHISNQRRLKQVAAKAQGSLQQRLSHACADSPELSLLTYMK